MVERRTAAIALLAILAVLALGVAAATLESTTTTNNSGGLGSGSVEDEVGFGDDAQGFLPLGRASSGPAFQFPHLGCPAFLTHLPVQLALLGLVFLFFLAVYRTTRSVVLSGVFVGAASLPFGLVYLLLISCTMSLNDAVSVRKKKITNRTMLPSGGGDAGMNAVGEALSTPTALVGLLLVLALLGSLALLFVSTGDDEEELADEDPDLPPPERRAAVGAAAGAAADRLEADAELQNEVYRSWKEMTQLLDVENPAASTPAEFAAAAVEAGMDREDVTDLTAVFEEVRYGGVDPTPDREEQAVDALRHIEETYAGDEAGIGENV